MDFLVECTERKLLSNFTIGKNVFHGVGKRGGGQLNTSGVRLYSVMSLKCVSDRTVACICGRSEGKVGDRT